VSTEATPLTALRDEAGGFDVVVGAAGDAQLLLDAVGLLRRNGVACLLGIDGRPQKVAIDGRVVAVDMILENRAVFGSVNAHRTDWETAVERLDQRSAGGPTPSTSSSAGASRWTTSSRRSHSAA
jgi:threonine dehydrogenase-like Zn-dependent dehydrogenase